MAITDVIFESSIYVTITYFDGPQLVAMVKLDPTTKVVEWYSYVSDEMLVYLMLKHTFGPNPRQLQILSKEFNNV